MSEKNPQLHRKLFVGEKCRLIWRTREMLKRSVKTRFKKMNQKFLHNLNRNILSCLCPKVASRQFFELDPRNCRLLSTLITLIQGTACCSCSLLNSVVGNTVFRFRNCLPLISFIQEIACCLRFNHS